MKFMIMVIPLTLTFEVCSKKNEAYLWCRIIEDLFGDISRYVPKDIMNITKTFTSSIQIPSKFAVIKDINI